MSASRPIPTVRVASGRLGMARRRGWPTAYQEAELRLAQAADYLNRLYAEGSPLITDHHDMLVALLDDLHTRRTKADAEAFEAWCDSHAALIEHNGGLDSSIDTEDEGEAQA